MSDFAPAAKAAAQIIAYLSECEQETGVSAISAGTGVNKNMVFRILNTLEEEGWVYCSDQKYALTLLPFKLTSRAISRNSLNTASLPALYDLHNATGESTYLGVLEADKVLYIQHLDGTREVHVAGRVGGEYDLYCSAPGKVLLAYAPEPFIEEYAGRSFEQRTENTVSGKEQLFEMLAAIRRDGFATDREEFGYGITCVAAPIFDYTDKVVGAIGCSAFTFSRNSDEAINRLIRPVLDAAGKISTRLGNRTTVNI